jgi:transposase-like protein
MREMSVAEQRHKAVLAVIADGRTVVEVAAAWSVSRQTLHGWLSRFEQGGLEAWADRSHRPEANNPPTTADSRPATTKADPTARNVHGSGPQGSPGGHGSEGADPMNSGKNPSR